MKYYEHHICLNCKRLYVSGRNTFGKYCSISCQKSYESDLKYVEWLNGNPLWSNKNTISYKNAVIKRDGYSCSKCSIEKWNGLDISLELEHLDGNSENNLPENLKLLCPNCHSQTLTYKGKNKGNGRYSRRLRYKEGKSF